MNRKPWLIAYPATAWLPPGVLTLVFCCSYLAHYVRTSASQAGIRVSA
jgi:hypothetical protein